MYKRQQIERVDLQKTAEDEKRARELAACETKFDAVVAFSAAGERSWDIEKFSLNGEKRVNWLSLLRSSGRSETDIVRHQLGRYKQWEAANKSGSSMRYITEVVDSLQAQLTALELAEARHKTSE